MMKPKKNLLLKVTMILMIIMGAVAVNTSLNNGNGMVAKAVDNTVMSVDTLGNLKWEEANSALYYKWSYRIGEEVSEVYISENNTVNVGIALTKAAQSAILANNTDEDVTNDTSACVEFTIIPVYVDGEGGALIYTYSFDKYIDYGYANHDFADIKAQAEAPTKISELSIDGCLDGWVSSAMFKNNLLTIGVRTNVELDENGLDFALFGMYDGVSSLGKYNYRIAQKMDGSVSVAMKTAYGGEWYQTFASETDYNNSLERGKPYYLSMGVFDTYDMRGISVGETLYYSRCEYDGTMDCLAKVGGFSLFIDSKTIASKNLTYKTTPSNTLASHTDIFMEVDVSAMHIYTNGNNDNVYVFSGIPSYIAPQAPTGLYYDNMDATFNWNSVSNVDAYEWKVGDENWQRTTKRKVNVETAINDYKALGYLPFSVRAVGGQVARYNLDLTRFYKARSSMIDYIDVCKSGDYTNNNKITWPTTLTGTYGPSGYTYINTSLAFGTHVTTKIKMTAEASASTKVYYMGLYGPGTHSSVNSSYNRYFMALYGDGTLQLGNGVATWSSSSGRLDKSKYWRMQNITDKLRFGYTYYITYGIDEVYEYDEISGEDVVAALRVSARIEVQEDGGLDRKLIAIVSYDHERFDEDGTGSAKYALLNTPSVHGKSSSSYVNVYRAINSTKYTVDFVADGETIASREVKFGGYYDFTDVDIPTAIPEGYDSFIGWTYEKSNTVKAFNLSGRYDITSGNLTVTAKFRPIEYTIQYDKESNNPTKYTIESEDVLSAPAVIPEGMAFDAWYASNDTSFENPITVLKGKTGNLNLVAHFADKCVISVIAESDTQMYTFKMGGTEQMTLIPPVVEDKTFVGWSVWNGNEYVEYNGDTTFAPNESKTFKANYEWTSYVITYELSGGSSTNATTYTADSEITFLDATRKGYFFLGWYSDNTYSNKIFTTQDCKGNITIYAKWMKNTLPLQTVRLDRSKVAQTIPIPELPYGVSYEVTLLKEGEILTVSDNQYVFDESGEYILQYAITLDTGDVIEYCVTYLVGDKYLVNIHYANGQTYSIMKIAGETIEERELPELPEGYKFGGLYLDSEYKQSYDVNLGISGDMNVYVKWIPIQIVSVDNPDNGQEGTNKGCSGSIFAGTEVTLIMLGAGIYVFMKRKYR